MTSPPRNDVDERQLRKMNSITCNLTLAVSKGNVATSAKHAAVPALKNFTPRVGSTVVGSMIALKMIREDA